jgi:membrane-bound serine protease (ClpP class)
MRTIAEQRDRNSEKLEDTVRRAIAYDATQAVELDVVDFIANDLADLLAQLHGRTVETAAGSRTLDTRALELRKTNMSFIDRFLFFLADPNITFLLLSLGGLGLVIELINPGLIIPGVVGAILLLLAFLSLGNLPVNWAAVGFILLAGVLAIAEVFVSGFGVLGVGAIVSFIFGGLLLFSSFGTPSPVAPSIGVSSWLLWSVAGLLTLSGIWFFTTVIQSRRAAKRAQPPPSPLIGITGVVTSDLAPRGTVQLEHELWTAVTEDDKVIPTGQRVKVLKVDGAILTVGRIEDSTG